MNTNSTSIQGGLPDLIKIDDITSGKIDPLVVNEELERLKLEINTLRHDMTLFIKAIATIGPNQSQQEYYQLVSLRLKRIQQSIKDYCAQYNKLLPIINLAQIKLGHEVESLPPGRGSVSGQANNTKIGNTNASGTNGSPRRRSSVQSKQNGSK